MSYFKILKPDLVSHLENYFSRLFWKWFFDFNYVSTSWERKLPLFSEMTIWNWFYTTEWKLSQLVPISIPETIFFSHFTEKINHVQLETSFYHNFFTAIQINHNDSVIIVGKARAKVCSSEFCKTSRTQGHILQAPRESLTIAITARTHHRARAIFHELYTTLAFYCAGARVNGPFCCYCLPPVYGVDTEPLFDLDNASDFWVVSRNSLDRKIWFSLEI